MKICVTGAAGFVGRVAVQVLHERGHEVVALVRAPDLARSVLPQDLALVRCELAEPEALTSIFCEVRPDALLHLAWEGLPDYSQPTCLRNLDMGLEVFSRAKGAGVNHIVVSGSCWEYAARQGALAEDAPGKFDQPFPAAKNRLREQGQALMQPQDGCPETLFTWLRLFFVYGPGQRQNSLAPSLILQALRWEKPNLRSPANRNDFIHVDDVALAFALVLEQRPGARIYNVGSGRAVQVADMARLVYTALDREELLSDLDIQTAGAKASEDFYADMSRMATDTGFAARVSLSEGVAGMIRHAQRQDKGGEA